VLSAKERKGYKIGKHTGLSTKLISRYGTYLTDICIHLMFYTERARELEKAVHLVLQEKCIKNEMGKNTEWFDVEQNVIIQTILDVDRQLAALADSASKSPQLNVNIADTPKHELYVIPEEDSPSSSSDDASTDDELADANYIPSPRSEHAELIARREQSALQKAHDWVQANPPQSGSYFHEYHLRYCLNFGKNFIAPKQFAKIVEESGHKKHTVRGWEIFI